MIVQLGGKQISWVSILAIHEKRFMNIFGIYICRAIKCAGGKKNPQWTLKIYTWFWLLSYAGLILKSICGNFGRFWRKLCNRINFESRSDISERRMTSKMVSMDFVLIIRVWSTERKSITLSSSLLEKNYVFRLAEYFMAWLELSSEEIVTLSHLMILFP